MESVASSRATSQRTAVPGLGVSTCFEAWPEASTLRHVGCDWHRGPTGPKPSLVSVPGGWGTDLEPGLRSTPTVTTLCLSFLSREVWLLSAWGPAGRTPPLRSLRLPVQSLTRPRPPGLFPDRPPAGTSALGRSSWLKKPERAISPRGLESWGEAARGASPRTALWGSSLHHFLWHKQGTPQTLALALDLGFPREGTKLWTCSLEN